jgi:hypothetical protein
MSQLRFASRGALRRERPTFKSALCNGALPKMRGDLLVSRKGKASYR